MMVARHVIVTGRVQGIFFRAWTKQQADQLGVSGWVRNRSDGSVEAFLEGDETAVADLIERMRSGPSAARVDRLDEKAAEPSSDKGFSVRH
ncbi:acylphosphatase [Sphingomonas sp. LY29]|uniref:acylphosphatase n=1 Tax=Sphingomonas sp. LY29 TaxID=3095341 RepID=UPI002D777859|nr:acylphosphatase [Sphingomonas sp. LY29]WRP26877.1 acylphosphatase [Sphingomonas sp. LY29]